MDHRRKWDKDEYERRAALSLSNVNSSDYNEEQHMPLDYLKPREYKLNLDSFKSRKEIIGTIQHKSFLSGGFHCPVCDIIVKSDLLFLDHLNGKRHQKLLGMSLKTRRSTFQEVRRRLRARKKELEEGKSINDAGSSMHDIQEEEQKLADLKEFRKAKKKRVIQEETDKEPSELQTVMGFSSFIFNKKK